MSIIRKSGSDFRVPPHWSDYEVGRRSFSWTAERAAMQGLPSGGINMAVEAVERQAARFPDKIAFRFLAANKQTGELSYAALAAQTRRFAAVLAGLGLKKGDRVFVLAGRIPELYVAVLGALRHGCVVTPLFSAFGPEPVATRIRLGAARLLVTTSSLYRRKVAAQRDQLPTLKDVLLVSDADDNGPLPTGTLDFSACLAAATATAIPPAPTFDEDPALLHFTSGTTGTPKGALHVHGAAVAHQATGRLALDLHAEDVFWCTADPGWVTGTSYGILAPLLNGVTSVVDREEFDAERWYGILQDEAVTVWYTAPTAIRMLMKAGAELARHYRFPQLRFIASVGEPLNPEAVRWGAEVLGLPVHDNWWQTETGGIMIGNAPAFDIKPGSMGRPLPGIEATIVKHHEDATLEFVTQPDVEGELALKAGWPSMFRGYLGDAARYRKCFAGPHNDWYLTGDLARRDADGYYWFIGRADDVIKSAGHLIGPFEVESVLMEHPAVAEAGVIGKPDAVVGEVVKAFVSLKAGFEASEALRLELLGHARKRLGAAVAPKEIAFLPGLPRTRSGKIMRRLLKARELGLPEGDLSTLEGSA